MTTHSAAPARPSEIEPAKRVIRTVIFIILGAASAIPYFVSGVHFGGPQVSLITGQVGGVAAALNALAITPAGQKALALIGLDAAAVTTAQTDGAQTGQDAVNALNDAEKAYHDAQPAVVAAVADPSKDAATVTQVASDAATVVTPTETVVGDVKKDLNDITGDVK